ncbi:MAG: ABC transporter permease [Sphaerochaeta sp.]|jgi:simple sugar transport system permease protein|uniref:ABC transporter permease n=1 Tax=Sphaerochaeta sp. TaxID=1972642 RepID=UPI002A362B77|nr:ABC transporter permease [Sphaerochaeta sp.]MDX9824678.1 ABC transporter permease [Sphaerochaeta sp.]
MNEIAIPVLHSAVAIMTPLLLAAMGGLFTELSGMLNIALEGLMLTGAFTSIVFTFYSGNMVVGVLIGIVCTIALAALLGTVTLHLKSNVFITGLATNLFASGLTVVLSFRLFGNKGVVVFDQIGNLPRMQIPFLQRIPIIGDLFIGHHILVYVSWILLLVVSWVLYRTPFGFRLRAAGLHETTLVSLGMRPQRYRFIAFLISGFTCGLAGAVLTLNLGAFVPNITSGKGWIALVVIFLGQKKPLGLLLAALVFGFADAFSNHAQGAWNIPADFILAIPYIFTLLAMVAFSLYTSRKNRVE